MKLGKTVVCFLSLVFAVTLLAISVPHAGAAVVEDDDAPVKKEPKTKKAEPAVESAPAAPAAEPAATPSEKPSRTKKVTEFPFYVYKDGVNPEGTKNVNHYYPSGWMGDYGDIKIDVKWKDNPHSGTSCIKTTYSAKGAQGAGWAGVYWQQPANNWGTSNAGYNITGAKKVTFWARGEKGTEVINEFKIGGIQGEYADTDVAGIGPVKLTTTWKQYTIDLTDKDLSRIAGGFCWATSGDENPDGFVMYFDDIVYEK